MDFKNFNEFLKEEILRPTGAEKLNTFWGRILMVVFSLVVGVMVAKLGVLIVGAVIGAPIGGYIVVKMFKKPEITIWYSLGIGFFATGLARYVDGPWGLMLDGVLVIGWLSILFRREKVNWKPIQNDIMLITLLWFGLVTLEIINPESCSPMAWFYAMRTVAFYHILTFGLVFMLMDSYEYLDKFFNWVIFFSIIGTLWGLRQNIFGVDAAEHYWLYVGGYAMTHILFGVLRVFSFYSDAGQFGASQAHVFIMSALMLMVKLPFKRKMLFIAGMVMGLIGFGISGTRGALAVPAIGGVMYLFVSRNFKLLIAGMIALFGAFSFLKFTTLLQNVEQVRRMRTAVNADDESLQVRLRNQVVFGKYLATRPFGAGVGSVGFWGSRFCPGSFLATMPTDSYYVKVWVETGVIGLCFHLFMFGYFIGKGGYIVYNLRDPVLKQKVAAIFAGMCGIFMANYGNQVSAQTPTATILYIGLPLMFMSPRWDDEIAAQKAKEMTTNEN